MAALVLLVVLSVWIAALEPLHAQPAADPAQVPVETAPVELDGVVLFHVRGLSSLPAEERARRIRARLATAGSDRALSLDALRAVDADGMTRLMAGDALLMAVVDADASLEQVGRAELAAVHLSRIRQALAEYRSSRSIAALRRAGVRVLAATLALAVSIAAVRWFRRRTDRTLTNRLQARIHGVGIQSFELVRADRIWSALRNGVIAIQTLTVLGVVLLYLGFVLAQLPWTRRLSRDMVAFAVGPLQVIASGLLESIPGLAFLTVLFVVVRFELRLMRLFFDAVAHGTVALGGFDREWAQPTYNLVRVAVIAFGLIVAYPYIPGSGSAAFRGVSIFLGIVFSLGSSSAVSNIIAGYMMTYRRAFKVGDRIRVGEAVGDVTEMRLQVTHLRSIKNEEIIVPNSHILASDVINYSSLGRPHGLVLHTRIGIGYETPWRQVEAMLMLAAGRTADAAREPRPFVLELALGDFAVTYELNVYCTQVHSMHRVQAELHRHILDVFNEYSVQIMTPNYERDPAEPKIVPREGWYASPASPPDGRPGPHAGPSSVLTPATPGATRP